MNERFNKDALLRELQEAGAIVRGLRVKCPFHSDRTPSGGVYQDQGGVWRYKCQASSCGFGGDVFDVRARSQNRPLADILKESNPDISSRPARQSSPPKIFETIAAVEAICPGVIENRFSYTNPDTGTTDLIVLRFRQSGRKQFWQITPNHTGFYLKAPPKPWPLYNRARVQAASCVIVGEGETVVHCFHKAGFVATTSPGGAGKAPHADWTPLAGKTVYLWPDNDSSGTAHMRDVADILDKLDPAPAVYWIEPAGLRLPEKGDAVDFLANVKPELHKSAVQSVLENAEPLGAASELGTLLEDTITGKRKAIDWPWAMMSRLTRALLPGTITLLCGTPGAGKSLFLLQALGYWFLARVKVACFELEEDRPYHLNRALAQQSETSDVLDPEWVAANPDKTWSIFAEHRTLLDGLGRTIYAAPNKQVSLDDIVKWAKARADAGCRVICVDPVTAAEGQQYTWIADSEFMFKIKAIARKYKVSVVLVTHPKKGRKTAVGLDELAGGAAYQRFSQCVIWLERHKEPKQATVKTSVGREECEINWTGHIIKARNAAGQGLGIGFKLWGDSLKFAEQGVIIPQEKK